MSNNYVSSSGLTLQSLTDIITELENGFKAIYGTDINVTANSPDGQMINLFAQAKMDILDCINSVYNSFSPSVASGIVLDQRVALNGLIRSAATYTTVVMNIVATKVVTLIGQDNGVLTPFTVADPAGNPFYLQYGATGVTGTNSLTFISSLPGAVEVVANTLTKITTPLSGVTSATNPSRALNQGIAEESDTDLRLRRSKSVANPSSGYLDGLIGGLLAIPNVLHALVYENIGPTADANNIPGHSIWPVIDYIGPSGATGATGVIGVTGAQTAIATEIYNRRNSGCGMTGSVTENILQVNGFYIPIKYSYVNYQNLHIHLTITSLNILHTIDETFIKNSIANTINYEINEIADYSEISSYVKTLDPYAVIISGGVGTTGPTGATHPYLPPTSIANRWVVQSANIDIDTV